MSISIKKTEGVPQLEAGLYPARLFSIIRIGNIEGYQGSVIDTVRFTFEIPSEKSDDGTPALISKEVSLSFSNRSFITKLAKATGTDTDVEDIDITELLGKTCMVNVEDKTSQSTGNKYTKIESVTPLAKGMEVEDQINDSFWFDVAQFDQEKFDTLPEFLQDKIKSSEEYPM